MDTLQLNIMIHKSSCYWNNFRFVRAHLKLVCVYSADSVWNIYIHYEKNNTDVLSFLKIVAIWAFNIMFTNLHYSMKSFLKMQEMAF